eukprot:2290019-Prymnesium_polylepis.2
MTRAPSPTSRHPLLPPPPPDTAACVWRRRVTTPPGVLLWRRSIFERSGAKVVVDESSLALLDGSTVDFEVTMMSSSFVVLNNPQSGSSCGCGTSFQAKE